MDLIERQPAPVCPASWAFIACDIREIGGDVVSASSKSRFLLQEGNCCQGGFCNKCPGVSQSRHYLLHGSLETTARFAMNDVSATHRHYRSPTESSCDKIVCTLRIAFMNSLIKIKTKILLMGTRSSFWRSLGGERAHFGEGPVARLTRLCAGVSPTGCFR